MAGAASARQPSRTTCVTSASAWPTPIQRVTLGRTLAAVRNRWRLYIQWFAADHSDTQSRTENVMRVRHPAMCDVAIVWEIARAEDLSRGYLNFTPTAKSGIEAGEAGQRRYKSGLRWRARRRFTRRPFMLSPE